MAEFEVKVVGAKRRRKPRRGGPTKPVRAVGGLFYGVLMRPGLLILAGLAGVLLVFGTPHVAGDYRCGHPKPYGAPCREMISCTYHGLQGRREFFPENGRTCSFVKLMPLDWGG